MVEKLIGRTLLNQYRIVEFIAAGGMGAVYRVWDLKRNVYLAMKVLHADLADDPAMFKRFQREARALQKLAHPNIVPFYGLHKAGDLVFMLERFIDGPTLKDLLRRQPDQPMSIPEALVFLKAVSAALGYAHANGVVHCDVKPANVMIDQGGNVYVTDFGIARHAESTTTTLASAGTPAYMTPEQIRGEAVTPATDVYALGVMLFEMLTGQRPFRGTEAGTESAGATAGERIRYAHLHLPAPDPRMLNPTISSELAGVILSALEKNPSQRIQDTMTFFSAVCTAERVGLQNVSDRLSQYAGDEFMLAGNVSSPIDKAYWSKNKQPWNSRLGILLVAFVAIALIGVVIFMGKRPPVKVTPLPPTQIAVIEQEVSPTPTNSAPHPAEQALIPTQTAELVKVQPTGIAKNFTQTPIQPVLNSQPEIIPTVPPTYSPNVPRGKIVFTCQVTKDENQDQICLVNADGTGFEQLTNDYSSRNLFPSLAPDGNSVVFVSNRTGNYEIYETDLNGRAVQLTYELGKLNAPEISPDERSIVFTNKTGGNMIWVMNRDGSNPRQIYGLPQGYGWDPAWSPDGTQILFASGPVDQPQLYIMNADGSNVHKVTKLIDLRGRSDWSPDGHTIATYSGQSWQREIILADLNNSTSHQITNGGNNLAPSFSPDGNWIAFTSYIDNYKDDDGCEIYIMRTDGSDIRRLTNNDYCDYQPRWGP